MSNKRADDGSNSSKPSSSLFFSLSSYNRFRLARSQRLDSLQTSSDSIPYSPSEISSAVKKLKIPIGSFNFNRCTLRNEKVVVFCRYIGFQKPDLSPSHLSTLTSRSHHPSIVKLLGASQSRDGGHVYIGDHVYMVYEDIPGATLKECLFTSNSNPLSNWIWRMQVALDLARGLEYIHHHCGMLHNMINSSSVIVTEPNSNASICLFGADDFRNGEIEGKIGYLAPEFLKYGIKSQKSDVYAFGVVILELVSGKAAFERVKGGSFLLLVENTRDTICPEAENEDEETRRGRVMQLVDRRLHDSFPMETAESLIKLALRCVEHVPDLRPEMASVAEDIRRLFLESKVWQRQTMKFPTTALSLSSLLRGETKEAVPPEGKLLHYPSLTYA